VCIYAFLLNAELQNRTRVAVRTGSSGTIKYQKYILLSLIGKCEYVVFSTCGFHSVEQSDIKKL
jgi:hypothetical protein